MSKIRDRKTIKNAVAQEKRKKSAPVPVNSNAVSNAPDIVMVNISIPSTEKCEVPLATEENDNLLSIDELVVRINASHAKAKASEEEALRSAWDAGNWLNKAFSKVEYGGWGKFLEEHCSDLGLTTIWRYRRLADGYSTVEELADMTLSEAYVKLGLATLQAEPVGTGSAASRKGGSGSSDKAVRPHAKLLGDLAKAFEKFDVPTSMSQLEKTAVKKIATALEEVHGKINGPSIISISWHDKLARPVPDWDREERALFEADFARFVLIHEQIQAFEEAA